MGGTEIVIALLGTSTKVTIQAGFRREEDTQIQLREIRLRAQWRRETKVTLWVGGPTANSIYCCSDVLC